MNKELDKVLVAEAAQALRDGQLVAFPTETVYGLGADAQNGIALKKLFAMKNRPVDHPVIVHLFCVEQIESWCKVVPQSARLLAKEFWPGPLTMILPRSSKALDLVTGGQNSVGIRIPSHPVAQELLQLFGDGVAAPSANKFGRLSPTSAQHVRADLGEAVNVILDGGNCQVGIESSIVDLSGSRPQILRPGMIGADKIAQVLGLKSPSELDKQDNGPRASGGLPSHYAPATPLKVLTRDELQDQINSPLTSCADGRFAGKVAVLCFPPRPSFPPARVSLCIEAVLDPFEYAKFLYSDLRRLDGSGADLIVVESLPETIAWSAIKDRLTRAANES